MELLREDRVDPTDARRTFRPGRVAPVLFAGALLAAACFGLPHALRALGGAHPLLWILVGPFAALIGLVAALTLWTAVASATAGFRATAWTVRLGHHGLHLNLRSHLNAHFPYDEPTVAVIPWGEVRRARLVRERLTSEGREGVRVEQVRWIELELDSGTEALERAVRRERERHAPHTSLLGVEVRSRALHAPVAVPGPGRVRIEHRRGLLEALRGFVPVDGVEGVEEQGPYAGRGLRVEARERDAA